MESTLKIFFLSLLLSLQLAHTQDISIKETLPSEGSEVVPDATKFQESKVEEVVTGAEPIENNPVVGVVEKIKQNVSATSELREQSTGTVMIGYQFLTTWLPYKKTISYTHIFNKRWSLEAEYSWASIEFPVVGIDLGSVKEKRFSLQARRYVSNSFHFSFGPVLSDFKARLGDEFLDDLGSPINSSFRVQNVGVTGGMGNRWQWKNGVTLGIDWLRISVPVFETKIEDEVVESIDNEDDQDDIKKIIRTFNRIPTFVLFGLNLGYTF